MNDFDMTMSHVTKLETDIWGLKYRPTISPAHNDDQDFPLSGRMLPIEVSDCNIEVVRSVMEEYGPKVKAMLEIGIARNGERSMSNLLHQMKDPGCFYLGIDLDDKSWLNDESKNMWTMQVNSHDQDAIRGFLRSKSIEKIDLLFIDGWHSVNTCVNDWMYADMLSPDGVVLLHDTNSHPGCITLFDAVDDALFSKTRYCLENDWGIAVFRRLPAA